MENRQSEKGRASAHSPARAPPRLTHPGRQASIMNLSCGQHWCIYKYIEEVCASKLSLRHQVTRSDLAKVTNYWYVKESAGES